MFEITKIDGNTVHFKNNHNNDYSGRLTITYTGANIDQGEYKYAIHGDLDDGTILHSKKIIVPVKDVPELSKEPINPAKVVKWVFKKLKDFICPDCLN